MAVCGGKTNARSVGTYRLHVDIGYSRREEYKEQQQRPRYSKQAHIFLEFHYLFSLFDKIKAPDRGALAECGLHIADFKLGSAVKRLCRYHFDLGGFAGLQQPPGGL